MKCITCRLQHLCKTNLCLCSHPKRAGGGGSVEDGEKNQHKEIWKCEIIMGLGFLGVRTD